jgi:hypothetical protein
MPIKYLYICWHEVAESNINCVKFQFLEMLIDGTQSKVWMEDKFSP